MQSEGRVHGGGYNRKSARLKLPAVASSIAEHVGPPWERRSPTGPEPRSARVFSTRLSTTRTLRGSGPAGGRRSQGDSYVPYDVLIRQCTTFGDYAACIELQRSVWGFDDLDITPLRSFVIARRGGGFTLGAFDGNEQLRGFAHALPAFDDDRQAYFYSQMLAVLPDVRNEGIGARLKLAQRDHAIAREFH